MGKMCCESDKPVAQNITAVTCGIEHYGCYLCYITLMTKSEIVCFILESKISLKHQEPVYLPSHFYILAIYIPCIIENRIRRNLTHCRLNRLSHTIFWKNPISILGTPG